MRTLIFGGTGMLGRALVAEARGRGWPALALSRAQADVLDRERLCFWSDSFRPQLVLNAAAFTRVDDCEAERERAMAVNGRAVGNVVAAARAVGARLLQVSSDYVFDGAASDPYREDAPTGPVSAYGESKLATATVCQGYRDKGFRIPIFRPRLIIGPGRLGILVKLFRLIDMNLPVPMIGSGNNPYQFISVFDCASACIAKYADPE